MLMKNEQKITKFAIPEIIFGRGSRKFLANCAKRLGGEKVYLVSDVGLEKVGWVTEIINHLKQNGLKCVYFGDITTNPKDYEVHRGYQLYIENKCDIVIALGGGSPMDAAKGIAVLVNNGKNIHDYEGANQINQPLPPMIFLPTTAGSGADISQFAIITDTKRFVKMTILSRTLIPNISIIDPDFLKTKPIELILSSSIDALSHAVESYVSVLASPFTEIQALKAIQLIIKYLPRVKENDLKILEKLSIASTIAAMSFSNAGLGVEHAIAHSLGGKYDIMHGVLHSILLPVVMEYNTKYCRNKMAKIGEIILGYRKRSTEATAKEGIEKLKELFIKLNMKTSLSEILPKAFDVKAIAEMAIKDVCILTNPRKVKVNDIIEICNRAM